MFLQLNCYCHEWTGATHPDISIVEFALWLGKPVKGFEQRNAGM